MIARRRDPIQPAARQAFPRIDKDQSGMLTRASLLALQFLGMTEQPVGLVLKHLDSDGDGLASVSEFMARWDGKLERLRKKFRSRRACRSAARACSNCSGSTIATTMVSCRSRSFRGDAQGRATEASVPDAELKEVLAHLDRDSDGSISMPSSPTCLRLSRPHLRATLGIIRGRASAGSHS